MKKFKSLQNKTVDVRIGPTVIQKKYSDFAKECLGSAPAQGVNINEMRQRIRVLDAIEKANGTIDLEPADLPLFKKCVSEMQWIIVSAGIVEFVNDVEELK